MAGNYYGTRARIDAAADRRVLIPAGRRFLRTRLVISISFVLLGRGWPHKAREQRSTPEPFHVERCANASTAGTAVSVVPSAAAAAAAVAASGVLVVAVHAAYDTVETAERLARQQRRR